MLLEWEYVSQAFRSDRAAQHRALMHSLVISAQVKVNRLGGTYAVVIGARGRLATVCSPVKKAAVASLVDSCRPSEGIQFTMLFCPKVELAPAETYRGDPVATVLSPLAEDMFKLLCPACLPATFMQSCLCQSCTGLCLRPATGGGNLSKSSSTEPG